MTTIEISLQLDPYLSIEYANFIDDKMQEDDTCHRDTARTSSVSGGTYMLVGLNQNISMATLTIEETLFILSGTNT